ncbi:DUF4391 domain-containing protein [Thermincola potens]|uniref:Methyl-accepting chemotaxis protein n=1 Tax=Thermincola potens (strain JR) TaxID=635013 RepID=D5XE65_THEPJ|nr:DUF4391 domain-containing protein [Thermincola potens]ADG81936.1 conserved hypothetical protein [Thermincola potens JR]
MFNLPDRTLYNRRIPKNKFYEKLKANTKLKDLFVEQVDYIVWKHKLSKDTVNLEPTEDVQEIQVFEIHLKQRDLSREILENIDKAIPYPIIHVLIYQNLAKFAVAYKQRNRNNEDRAVIRSYYESDWQPIKQISVNLLQGLDLQATYENFIRSLMSVDTGADEELSDVVRRQEEIERLTRECARLEARIKSERQFNRKVELNMELQKKRKELISFGVNPAQ